MNKFLRFLPVALLALMASAVSAQQLPVLTVNMTEIDVNGVPAFGAHTLGQPEIHDLRHPRRLEDRERRGVRRGQRESRR